MGTPRQFVILEHDHQGTHYDLMLEVGGVLKTWRLEAPLTVGSQSAEASFDHRILYLDYEGPISGDRGQVRRWDRGTYLGDVSDADFLLEIRGQHLHGKVKFTPQSSSWIVTYAAEDT